MIVSCGSSQRQHSGCVVRVTPSVLFVLLLVLLSHQWKKSAPIALSAIAFPFGVGCAASLWLEVGGVNQTGTGLCAQGLAAVWGRLSPRMSLQHRAVLRCVSCCSTAHTQQQLWLRASEAEPHSAVQVYTATTDTKHVLPLPLHVPLSAFEARISAPCESLCCTCRKCS